MGSSRYHIIIEDRYFDKILQNNFVILKKAKRIKEDVTLSIGVGRGGKSLSECDALAKRALDMALGRGGDQAVIKPLTVTNFSVAMLREWKSVAKSAVVLLQMPFAMLSCKAKRCL